MLLILVHVWADQYYNEGSRRMTNSMRLVLRPPTINQLFLYYYYTSIPTCNFISTGVFLLVACYCTGNVQTLWKVARVHFSEKHHYVY